MTQVDRPAGGPDKQRMSKEDSELADTQREIAKDLFCGGCCYWICGGGSRYQDESLQSGSYPIIECERRVAWQTRPN